MISFYYKLLGKSSDDIDCPGNYEYDDYDNVVVLEALYEQVAKQSYRAMRNSMTTGTDLFKLPTFSQQYEQSINFNALNTIVIHHPTFH